jgi:hypothetical protein
LLTGKGFRAFRWVPFVLTNGAQTYASIPRSVVRVTLDSVHCGQYLSEVRPAQLVLTGTFAPGPKSGVQFARPAPKSHIAGNAALGNEGGENILLRAVFPGC